MNRNRFIALVIITLVAAGLVAVLEDSGTQQENAGAGPLLPGLEAVVNEVTAIDIVAPGGAKAVRLRRDEERWRVPEKDGYEADFQQVVDFLRDLTEARTVEDKTDRPEWYARLGVQDVGADDATGRRIDFPDRELPSVIIGQTGPTGSGSYARRAGEAQSWLLDRVIEVPVDPVEWLEPGIMDIPSSDIERVVIRHPDGETIRIRRAGEEDPEFVLLDVPEGREAGQAYRRTAIANGLRALNLEDVRRHDPEVPERAVPDDAVRVLFTTTDGLNFIAELFERDDLHWVHFSVSAENAAESADGDGQAPDEAQPEDEAETQAGTDSGEKETDDAGQDADGTTGAEAGDEPDKPADGDTDSGARRLADATAVDDRLSPWLFAIPESRYDDLTVRMDDLLAPVEEKGGDESRAGDGSPTD